VGTEAAAATAVAMVQVVSLNVDLSKPVLFHADHPFLYFLEDPETGAVLFAGRVADPR
jgi:serpin B